MCESPFPPGITIDQIHTIRPSGQNHDAGVEEHRGKRRGHAAAKNTALQARLNTAAQASIPDGCGLYPLDIAA